MIGLPSSTHSALPAREENLKNSPPARPGSASPPGVLFSPGDLGYSTPPRKADLQGDTHSLASTLAAPVSLPLATPHRPVSFFPAAICTLEKELLDLAPALANHRELEDSFHSRLAALKESTTADVIRRPSSVQALAGLSAQAGNSLAATPSPNLSPLDPLGLHHYTKDSIESGPAALGVQTLATRTLHSLL